MSDFNHLTVKNAQIKRAQGVLLGQVAGDSLGSLVEFKMAETIRDEYPDGVQLLADGGTWNTLAGQATDDSEMSIALARTLIENGAYSAEKVRLAYCDWLDSKPFDYGNTVYMGLRGEPNLTSQANGAMMRACPLGIMGANVDRDTLVEWAREDARLTHPHTICQQANVLYVLTIAHAIKTGCDSPTLYTCIEAWADELRVDAPLREATLSAQDFVPFDFHTSQGWVLIAWQNALYQLLHAPDFKTGVVNTVKQGGDTDTNACICGALLGAVYGVDAVPVQWRNAVLDCRPEAGKPNVHRPRPPRFWASDVLALAEQLIIKGE